MYYVLSDKLHGYMFRQLDGHLQGIKVHKEKITVASSFLYGWIVISSHGHYDTHTHTYIYTGCPRRNVPDFGRVFLMLKYTDITQNTYVQS